MEKYPTISLTELQKLKTILNNASDIPKYLDGRICPYDAATREILKELAQPPAVASLGVAGEPRGQVGAPKKGPILPISELEKEFEDLRKEIQELKADAKGLEPNEKIQIVKTRAALVEKILSMKERITNVKKTQNFIAVVMQILEDELPQEARLRVIEKLEPYAEEE